MNQHPYFDVLATCLVFLTFLSAVVLVILSLLLWTKWRTTVEARHAMQDAIASVKTFEDELTARRNHGGQSA